MRRMSADQFHLFAGTWIVVVTAAIGAHATGYYAGRRRLARGQKSPELGAVQGALLGLLGLMLAFSFGSAAERFVARRDLILEEANAIGTAYLRADLLPSPHAEALRSALARYVDVRVAFFDAGIDEAAVRAAMAQSEQLHAAIWSAGMAGVREVPTAGVIVLPALNEVIDLHASRVDALRRHLPTAVVAMLLAIAALAVSSVGYGSGFSGASYLSGSIAFVVASVAVLGLTLDLDYPRAGLVRVSQVTMLELQQSLKK
jgi:hypothetical protein